MVSLLRRGAPQIGPTREDPVERTILSEGHAVGAPPPHPDTDAGSSLSLATSDDTEHHVTDDTWMVASPHLPPEAM